MSQIPSDVSASAAQAGFQAREVDKDREARRAGESHASDRQSKSIDQTDTTVDTEDADVAVFTNAEGGGSQGREPGEEQAEDTPDKAPGAVEGITQGDDGRLHLDLEA